MAAELVRDAPFFEQATQAALTALVAATLVDTKGVLKAPSEVPGNAPW